MGDRNVPSRGHTEQLSCWKYPCGAQGLGFWDGFGGGGVVESGFMLDASSHSSCWLLVAPTAFLGSGKEAANIPSG